MPIGYKWDGFSGEIAYVLPREVVNKAASHPLVQPILVTDIGYYPHAHRHRRNRRNGVREHIFILCTEGSGWADVAGTQMNLNQDSALIIPKDVPHVYGSNDDCPWSIYWGHFRGTNAEYFLSQTSPRSPIVAVSEACRSHVISDFANVFATMRRGYTLAGMIAVSASFADILSTVLFANDAFHPNLQTETNRKIDRSIEFMLAHIDKRLTVRVLADHAELSDTHFSHLFREKTGHPPLDFFLRLKVQRACHLLDRTDHRVYEVAGLVGYQDQYYFSRLFRKVMGLSPREYQTRDVDWRGRDSKESD